MTTEWTIFLMMFTALGTALICAVGFHLDSKEEKKEILAENKALRKEIAHLREQLENRW